MGEDAEICCDRMARALRHKEIVIDEGDFNVTDECGAVVLFDVQYCPFCAESVAEIVIG